MLSPEDKAMAETPIPNEMKGFVKDLPDHILMDKIRESRDIISGGPTLAAMVIGGVESGLGYTPQVPLVIQTKTKVWLEVFLTEAGERGLEV